jgi:glycosyltransferase involved in cell wall biosynthesis
VSSKILFLQHRYFNRAGTEEHSRLLSKGLASNFDISILAIEPLQNGRSEIVLIKNETVTSRWAVPTLAFPETPTEHAVYETILNEVLSVEAPDLIHIHHLMNWPIKIAEELQAHSIPLAYTLHDYYAMSPEYTFQSGAVPLHTEYYQQRFDYFKQLLSSISLIAPSPFVAEMYKKTFGVSALVVPHGIAPILESVSSSDKNLKDSEPSFGYIGSLLPQKGFDILIRAFQHYRKQGGLMNMHIFGGVVPIQVKGITFYDAYDAKDLHSIMKQFTVGIIPSRFPETFCLTLSELWAAGKYVIASNQGALFERIESEGKQAGVTYDSNSILSLADAMKKTELEKPWLSFKTTPVRTDQQMCEDYRQLYHDILNRSDRTT